MPFVGVRTFHPPHRQFASQQTTELHAIAWGIWLAIQLHRRSITILNDGEAAIAQVLRVRAKSCLRHKQYVSCSIVRILWVSRLVVRLARVTSAL